MGDSSSPFFAFNLALKPTRGFVILVVWARCYHVHVDRPVYLKIELYEHILDRVGSLPTEKLKTLAQQCGYNIGQGAIKETITQLVLNKPASFLEETGILDNTDWLTNLVIELDDGVNYHITERAAKELSSGCDYILLTRLIDKKPIVHTRETIVKALQNNNCIDYLETLERKRKESRDVLPHEPTI